jgi:hippurate hydrolase
VRSFSRDAHARILAESEQVCRGIAAAHGLDVDAECAELYPVTINTAAAVAAVEEMVRDIHGEGRFLELPNPVAGSEDFSRVLDQVPGAMVFLGATLPERDPGTAPFNHSPEAAFADSVLADGVALYAEFALRALTD